LAEVKNVWVPPNDWIKIKTIEAHAAGEPLRVIVDGFPDIPGNTILERRRFLKNNLDYLRTALVWEPRGHADMYGAIITEPVHAGSDVGVIFLHNEGYSTMCGHGVIALVTVLLETGMVKKDGDRPTIKLDTPAGMVTATARREGDKIKEVSFQNVPSFVYLSNQTVDVPMLGKIRYDVAFGGAFYAFVDAEEIHAGLDRNDFRQLIDLGIGIKKSVMESTPIKHPFEDDLSFLYGTIFVGKPHSPEHHSRNVCIFADGEVDRSPTGTGVSARAAIHYFKNELSINESFTVESIIGTCFTGKVLETKTYGGYEAVVPEVTGSASIVGMSEWLLDPQDPLKDGFILR
jgi:proline racemase